MFSGNKKWIWIIGAIVILAGAFFFLRQRGNGANAAAQGEGSNEAETAVVFVGDLAKRVPPPAAKWKHNETVSYSSVVLVPLLKSSLLSATLLRHVIRWCSSIRQP